MSSGPYRLASGGRIDRRRAVAFRLEGRALSGFVGDTLASALLANGVQLIGRSFKYHRPRGFLSAGVEEPSGLFTLGQGARTEPNVQGTITELTEGLIARRQNGWPSADFDLMGVNALLAPLFSAGFYYKTFMGPTRGAWMFYERFIRRAAGLGRAVHARDPDRYETRHAHTDVLVIGGGPAGLAAGLTAGEAGARVMLVEQDFLLGGSLLLEASTGPAEVWRAAMASRLSALRNVEVCTRTTGLGVYDGNTVALLTRRDHLNPDASKGDARQVLLTVRARAIVFATGAIERPLIFPNNDRPGVMLASAARTYLNRFGVACGHRAVVVAHNDSAWATALDLASAGVSVTVADLRPAADPVRAKAARARGIECRFGASGLNVLGRRGVTGVVFQTRDGTRHERECDLLCVSGGWSPAVHVTSHGGVAPRFREDLGTFVPGGFGRGQFGAGALVGSATLDASVQEGLYAGRHAAVFSGQADAASVPLPATPVVGELWSPSCYRIEPLWPTEGRGRGKSFVDFQNDVTVRDLQIAHEEGYASVEHLKRYTTLGMGTDQGKTSNISGLAIMANLRGVPIPSTSTTTFRPPYTPVPIGALAGRSIGHHFRPVRRSPLHDWHVAYGAEMIEAGPWMRVWWYRWAGDCIEKAYVEEMRLVRRGVGLSDVSTLGKIDVQGPDAGEFLNRVYVNGFAQLPVGKARYGVMLTDDGVVLDDGTTTRLADTRYFMTTTTAQAAEVMSWLEFLAESAWPDLKVRLTSLTDEWAGMAVAGPKARQALELAFPGEPLSDAKLPHMGCRETHLFGVPLKLIRLSFSGELAFEIYTPADFAVALWEHVLKRAAPLGIRPYGLESLASLRIEKGHVAGLELDHRNTLDDLGLGKMASASKPFVGQVLRQRHQLQTPERWSLVGLDCLEAGKRLRGGSILFAATDKIEGHGRGYITSVTWSTELERYIALGLYQGGLKHLGEDLVCAYPLKGEQVRARIVSPVFIDPKGERLRV